jgi:ribosome-interacting GTPase 1
MSIRYTMLKCVFVRIMGTFLVILQVYNSNTFSMDEFIDVIMGNCMYMPCLYVYNKIDQISIEELDRLARQPHSVCFYICETQTIVFV